jgi:hypothetical protein
VEVRSHVLGEAEDPEPVQLAIETRCPRDVEREADSAVSSPDQGIDSDEAAPDGARASGCAFVGHTLPGDWVCSGCCWCWRGAVAIYADLERSGALRRVDGWLEWSRGAPAAERGT